MPAVLCETPSGTLRDTERRVETFRALVRDLQVATATLGSKYYDLVVFIREGNLTDFTARWMMEKGGMRKERISEVFRLVRGPQEVIDALGNRLIGFKAALQAARIKDQRVHVHGDMNRRAFDVWKRFAEEFGQIIKSQVEEFGIDIDAPAKIRVDWWDDLLKGGDVVAFEFGPWKVHVRAGDGAPWKEREPRQRSGPGWKLLGKPLQVREHREERKRRKSRRASGKKKAIA